MWANKSDNVISYYRPNHHENKSSPEVTIYIQKVKRLRTGGKCGQFDLRMNWAIKRFVHPMTEVAFCDPKMRTKNDWSQPEMRLPYADDKDTDLPF